MNSIADLLQQRNEKLLSENLRLKTELRQIRGLAMKEYRDDPSNSVLTCISRTLLFLNTRDAEPTQDEMNRAQGDVHFVSHRDVERAQDENALTFWYADSFPVDHQIVTPRRFIDMQPGKVSIACAIAATETEVWETLRGCGVWPNRIRKMIAQPTGAKMIANESKTGQTRRTPRRVMPGFL